MKPAFETFALLLLLLLLVVPVAQAQAKQDSLMELEEEEQVNDGQFLPQHKLIKNRKRLDAIDLRKKIIAKIYKRDSNIKRRTRDKKDKQPEKEREDLKKRRHRPFPNPTEPEIYQIYQMHTIYTRNNMGQKCEDNGGYHLQDKS